MDEQNITQQYLTAWNNHDADALLSCFHQDGVYIDANLDQEIPAKVFAQRAQELFDCFPNLKVSINSQTTSTDTLTASSWTIDGALPGKTLSGVDMLCIRDNKLQSVQVYFDFATGRLFAKVPSLHLNYSPQTTQAALINQHNTDIKYKTSGLNLQQMTEIKSRLEETFQKQKLFLKSDLTLKHLADHLNQTTNHLSQVINSQYDMNFYDFVNSHRIQHAKTLISNDQAAKLTSLVISLESGFNSTSTFYSAFKKHTHLTPSQFRQANQPSANN
jgi:AraC-like DNA-binding protein